ncbi:hypothetical protein [Azospirillum sp. ST 5-10]|uniref:hypothetical protein n=1 Tax=unclassified Azospirillum TaxID=2630922 RepID=UPI003F4A5739
MKLRQPGTLKDGVSQALVILGDDGASRVAGKSTRLVRYWADPDDDDHHLPAYQMVALDRACMAADAAPPLLAGYRAELRRGRCRSADPLALVAALMIEVGQATSAVSASLSARSAGGSRVTPEELRAILQECAEVHAVVDRLEEAAQAAAELLGAGS